MDDLAGAAKKVDDTGNPGDLEFSNDDSIEIFDLEKHKHAKSLSKTKASNSNEESESVEILQNQKKTYYLYIIKNVITY
jgi:hypothetical protein